MNNGSVRALKIKEFELIDSAVIAGDNYLIHARPDLVFAKEYVESNFRQVLPGVPLDPGVLIHLLHMVRERLPEQSVSIVDAYALSGIAKRRYGVHEAC